MDGQSQGLVNRQLAGWLSEQATPGQVQSSICADLADGSKISAQLLFATCLFTVAPDQNKACHAGEWGGGRFGRLACRKLSYNTERLARQ